MPAPATSLRFAPATPDRWDDVARLFGERGACGGCWCQWWRLPKKTFDAGKGDANRDRLRAVVRAGEEPGIIAYAGDEPVGWCAVAPRASYPRFETSRVLAPVDDHPVWSITCLFVTKTWRRRGVSVALLREAVAFARARGGDIVEGYPVAARKPGAAPDAFVFTGLPSAFVAAGFVEVARRSGTRPIFRTTSPSTPKTGAKKVTRAGRASPRRKR